MEREVTVRHVFVGFVEGMESGTLSNVTCWSVLYSFIRFLLAEAQFALQ